MRVCVCVCIVHPGSSTDTELLQLLQELAGTPMEGGEKEEEEKGEREEINSPAHSHSQLHLQSQPQSQKRFSSQKTRLNTSQSIAAAIGGRSRLSSASSSLFSSSSSNSNGSSQQPLVVAGSEQKKTRAESLSASHFPDSDEEELIKMTGSPLPNYKKRGDVRDDESGNDDDNDNGDDDALMMMMEGVSRKYMYGHSLSLDPENDVFLSSSTARGLESTPPCGIRVAATTTTTTTLPNSDCGGVTTTTAGIAAGTGSSGFTGMRPEVAGMGTRPELTGMGMEMRTQTESPVRGRGGGDVYVSKSNSATFAQKEEGVGFEMSEQSLMQFDYTPTTSVGGVFGEYPSSQKSVVVGGNADLNISALQQATTQASQMVTSISQRRKVIQLCSDLNDSLAAGVGVGGAWWWGGGSEGSLGGKEEGEGEGEGEGAGEGVEGEVGGGEGKESEDERESFLMSQVVTYEDITGTCDRSVHTYIHTYKHAGSTFVHVHTYMHAGSTFVRTCTEHKGHSSFMHVIIVICMNFVGTFVP